MISLVEISKNTEVKKAICPQCKKTIHSIGFKKGSTCNGITVVCKFCGRVFEVKADQKAKLTKFKCICAKIREICAS